jgi:serine/threonine protein kinase
MTRALLDVDFSSPPFDQLRGVHRLTPARSGHASWTHARHQLYAARHSASRANVLVKLTSKPGVVYEKDLANEIASLSAINRALPASRHFPLLSDHGRLCDGRLFLTISLFDEWPLATTLVSTPSPPRQAAHLRTMIEVARIVAELHDVKIWHVDLNPMNILARWEAGAPVVRIVDFESSYDVARHSSGAFYDPPTTPGYSAPELSSQVPDARSDVFSLGAVLYTMLAGYGWTRMGPAGRCIASDREMAPDLKDTLLAAVAPEPRQRFESASDFRAALSAYLDRTWPSATPIACP